MKIVFQMFTNQKKQNGPNLANPLPAFPSFSKRKWGDEKGGGYQALKMRIPKMNDRAASRGVSKIPTPKIGTASPAFHIF
jgi:hypothetical protein